MKQTNKKRDYIIAIAISIVLLGLIAYKAYDYFFKDATDPKVALQLKPKKLDIVFGNDSADLTIYMYSSYSCSYCRRFFKTVFPKLKENFIDKNRVKLIMRLTSNTRNLKRKRSLKAAVCVNKYGNFEYLHKLMLHDPKVIFRDEFQQMINEFTERDPFVGECIDGTEAQEYLYGNFKEFSKLGLKGTPSFVIANVIYPGYREYSFFEKTVKKHLVK